jgi:hypothetical protein
MCAAHLSCTGGNLAKVWPTGYPAEAEGYMRQALEVARRQEAQALLDELS